MPELPEVETVVRTLENQIHNEQIKKVEVLWDGIIVGNPKEFKKKLINQHFNRFDRRGKYLIFELDDCILLCHLRMEGKFFYVNRKEKVQKHEHVLFELYNGKQLRYHDTRKFGKMELLPKNIDVGLLKNLGPEPWDKDFNEEYVTKELKKRRGSIKQALLDQSFVAGVGNIYADEICFAMGVHPARLCSRITKRNREDLVIATRKILKRACELGGTTIRSYTSTLGVTGRFQLEVKVHQRAGQKCRICGTPIIKTKVATRGTYYCPKCQKR